MNGPSHFSAGHWLRHEAGALAEASATLEFADDPRRRLRQGPAARQRARQDTEALLGLLADAVDVRSPALFLDHVAWAKQMLCGREGDEVDLDHRLGCLAQAVSERLPAAQGGAALAMIAAARAALPELPSTSASQLDPAHRLTPLAQQYLQRLLGGYRGAASRLVTDAVANGESVQDLYLHVFQPVLHEVGRLWQERKVTVAQEHFCTAATQMLMGQLVPPQDRADGSAPAIVIACVSGDQHDMGARMLADFFELAGWSVYYCGANMPADAVAAALADRRARVLAVSVTMGHHLHRVAELIDTVHADPGCRSVRIMVGGRPFNLDPGLCASLRADGSAPDAATALALARQWTDEERVTPASATA